MAGQQNDTTLYERRTGSVPRDQGICKRVREIGAACVPSRRFPATATPCGSGTVVARHEQAKGGAWTMTPTRILPRPTAPWLAFICLSALSFAAPQKHDVTG